MENLIKVDEETYVYRLTHSKTDQMDTEHNADADKPWWARPRRRSPRGWKLRG
jgi:hypothetical protein